MIRPTIALEVLDIARPCSADWNDMRGDERVRFCKHCSLHVYNLSAMTRDAAQQLIAEREGRVCIRMYRREDGTVITRDCGGAVKLAAKRISRFVTTTSALVLSGVFAAIGWSRSAGAAATEKCDPAIVSPRAIMGDVAPTPLMGKIAVPATQPVKMGEATVLMGAPAPLPPPPPPQTQPTQPTTQPAVTGESWR